MKITDELVLFYGQSEFYSNWNKASFWFKGLHFDNGEQFMMFRKAMLFGDMDMAWKILAEPDPAEVKALGRSVSGFVEKVWVANRQRVVREGLLEKARQHPRGKAMLLATGNRILVEASGSDVIWGIGLRENDPHALDPTKWRGLNELGEGWMWVRGVLQAELVPAQ
jgi:ribA/ribD-fused uncharacterized protein